MLSGPAPSGPAVLIVLSPAPPRSVSPPGPPSIRSLPPSPSSDDRPGAGDQRVVAFAAIDLGHVRLDRVELTGDAAVGQPIDFRGHRPRSAEEGHGRDPAFAVEGLVAAVVAVDVGGFEVEREPEFVGSFAAGLEAFAALPAGDFVVAAFAVELVFPAAAVEHVVAGAAAQDVVAWTADKDVVAGAAGEDVVVGEQRGFEFFSARVGAVDFRAAVARIDGRALVLQRSQQFVAIVRSRTEVGDEVFGVGAVDGGGAEVLARRDSHFVGVFGRIDVVAVAGFGLRAVQRAHDLRPGLKLDDRILEFAVVALEAACAATGRGQVFGRSGVADRLARRGVRRGSAHERAYDAREENCAGEGRRGLG